MGRVNLQDQEGNVLLDSFTKAGTTTAYDAGDVCGTTASDILTFNDVIKNTGGMFAVTGVSLRTNTTALPATMGTFRLHLYKSAPAGIADNTAFNLPTTETNYLGFVTIPPPVLLGSNLFIQEDNKNFTHQLGEKSTSLYGILQTVDAFNPSSACTKIVGIKVVGL